MTSIGLTLWSSLAHSVISAQLMESGTQKKVNDQSACREPISSRTEWSANGMPCLRQLSNQSLSASSNPDMIHSRLLPKNAPVGIVCINYLYYCWCIKKTISCFPIISVLFKKMTFFLWPSLWYLLTSLHPLAILVIFQPKCLDNSMSG